MTEQRLAMTIRDRLMRGAAVIGMIGPLEVPAREEVVAALRRIAREGLHTRVALGFHVDGKNWSYDTQTLDEWCDEIVVTVAPATADTILALATQQAWLIDAEHPLRFVLAGDYVIQLNDHSLGDGVMFLDRLATVLHVASGDVELPSWVTTKPHGSPLVRAMKTTFVAQRGAVRELLDERKADRSLPRESIPGPTVRWRPELVVIARSSPTSALKELQRWIRATDRTVTVAAALIVVLRRSLADAGIEMQRDTEVVYNLRRYLPADSGLVSGNFIAGLPVRVADPDDPKQVAEGIRIQLESGRPLAALALGVGRKALFGTQAELADEVHSTPRAMLVFNNLGVARSLQSLPWKTGPEERTCSFVVRSDEPDSITVLLTIIAGVIHLSASFHSNVFDEQILTAAFEHALANPVALLESHAGT
jgi:hypothetical protein